MKIDLSARTRGGRARLAAAIVVAGLALATLVAAAAGLPASDTVALAGFALAGSAAATLVIALLARIGHGTSLLGRLLVVGAMATGSTAAGVGLSARAMFISGHDLGVLAVVLVVSAALAGAGALVISGQVAEEADQLARLAQRLGTLGPLDREAAETDQPADREPTPTSTDSSPAATILSAELRTVATELQTAHDRLDMARRRALALDTSRRELVAWVSHDLRSPIASVRAMAEALEDGVVDDPESMARYHHSIRTETERLGTLVDDLFELSRISSGVAATADADLVPLDELLLDVVEGAGGAADTRGIALDHRLAADEAPLVPGDMRRVLRNLVDNAIAATEAGGRVTVVGRLDHLDGEDHPAVTLDVTDECGGIDDTHLPRLFDVGYRADAARRRDGGGGLGLAIARGLVEAHQGRISVANDGPGCRFTVSLPLGETT
ncbi:MAG: sensor histidine kinase [Iamia sp.]